MRNRAFFLIAALLLFAGCGFTLVLLAASLLVVAPRFIPQMGPPTLPAPDMAVYSGVYFQSWDGMKRYNDIDILPRLLKEPVFLVLPDDSRIDVCDINVEFLREHGVVFQRHNTGGQGNCDLTIDGNIQVTVKSHRVARVAVFRPNGLNEKPIRIELKGKQIVLPKKRADLEALLGSPDEIKLDTFPEVE